MLKAVSNTSFASQIVRICLAALYKLAAAILVISLFGAGITPLEHVHAAGPDICDGIDNDGDGRRDEDGDASCDDGLWCTIDRCQTTPIFEQPISGLPGRPPRVLRWIGKCVHKLSNDCQRRGKCEHVYCSKERRTLGPGERAASLSKDGLCWAVQRDNWCTNIWDSCNSNGPEICSPKTASADKQSGCAPALRPPCADKDFCTLEPSCEDNKNCRDVRKLSERAQKACQIAKRLGAGTYRPFAPGSSIRVFCPTPPKPPIRKSCPVGNSCTIGGGCDSATGNCRQLINRPFNTECRNNEGLTATRDRCGRFRCSLGLDSRGLRSCELAESSRVDVDCLEKEIPIPAGTLTSRPIVRLGWRQTGSRVQYKHRNRDGDWRTSQSCHVASCNDGECNVILSHGLCTDALHPPPPPNSCQIYRCIENPYVRDNGIRGCQLQTDLSLCTIH